ncbi:hypothetical protein B6U91_02050 [Candidatus Pacearchaeota archaeon ex4484_71]|nr:MAG: hypothetical protein B6U91_02050 [Candidatus Pacearchaeota archaeon ex4484_71]
MESFVKNLRKAEEGLKKVERLIVLAQVSRNKNLMLIALEEIENVVKNCISSILHYDYELKRVKIYKDSRMNFREFEVKSSRNLSLKQEELHAIKEILEIANEHRKSPMEFMKQKEVIILSEDQRMIKVSMEKLTHFVSIAQELLKRIKFKIKR